VSTSSHDGLVRLLRELYGSVTEAVSELDAAGFLKPTRADAWCVQDLLFHLLLDVQRALMAFASQTTAAPEVDAVTYWRSFRPDAGDGGVAHARFVRIASSAYAAPEHLVRHWRSTADAAVRAASATDATTSVQTQGHVLTASDLVNTLVVEATVHVLDLALAIEVAPPSAEALTVVRSVLDGLLGEPVHGGWSDEEYVLKGTGRVALTASDRHTLGARAARLPLLG
jgi:hypothetical protein